MIRLVQERIKELDMMKTYPSKLFYKGNLALLKKRKISIVGSRKPTNYTKNFTRLLASELSKRDICIVSGGAMGVDAISHMGAGSENTIAVMANGLDIRYPSVNTTLIKQIEEKGLCLSTFCEGERARPYSFVARNELVVALGEILIVTQADKQSGSMRSVEFAQAMGKEIYVLPQRVGESEGTNELLAKGLAKCIYDVENFLNIFGLQDKVSDEILEFCATNPPLELAYAKFGEKIYEYELDGKICIHNGFVTKG